jgi:hypothetical protein
MRLTFSLLLAAGLTASVNAADLAIDPARVEVAPQNAAPDQAAQDAAPTTASQMTSEPARVEYAAEGSRWWIITGGWGHGFSSNEESKGDDFNVAAAYSYFIVKDVEVNAELGTWYHSQPGDDAGSINLSMVFRWHFVDTGKWTVFADAGIGFLVASEEVPQGGTNFDFTPRAGVGFTHQLGDSNSRLIMGIRWAHFSNARIAGDDDNPSRDDAMIYGGVIFPF